MRKKENEGKVQESKEGKELGKGQGGNGASKISATTDPGEAINMKAKGMNKVGKNPRR